LCFQLHNSFNRRAPFVSGAAYFHCNGLSLLPRLRRLMLNSRIICSEQFSS
jgi:hypothetical protein